MSPLGMSWRRWYWSTFRWPEFDLSATYSIFRWPDLSYFTGGWTADSFRWFDFSIFDDVLWTVITALESLALVAMLCCFFIFCGCTLKMGDGKQDSDRGLFSSLAGYAAGHYPPQHGAYPPPQGYPYPEQGYTPAGYPSPPYGMGNPPSAYLASRYPPADIQQGYPPSGPYGMRMGPSRPYGMGMPPSGYLASRYPPADIQQGYPPYGMGNPPYSARLSTGWIPFTTIWNGPLPPYGMGYPPSAYLASRYPPAGYPGPSAHHAVSATLASSIIGIRLPPTQQILPAESLATAATAHNFFEYEFSLEYQYAFFQTLLYILLLMYYLLLFLCCDGATF
ncbi:hypothetical protein RJ640_014651 [Escallonia rubra]|uniref:Uncharacterized protein n=1 Tax=Escallonia rubra TaxID=112253 RepID=A0AA88RIA5_9ASTE|nr:hypothetical protein RJ640_014651 [Escallonia rubra]